MGGEIIVAIGLVFVIEGLIWSLFPNAFGKLAAMAAETPEGQLRASGLIAMAFGVLLVWLVRG